MPASFTHSQLRAVLERDAKRINRATYSLAMDAMEISPFPYYICGSADLWPLLVEEERVACDRAHENYTRFPDRRVSDAVRARKYWEKRCSRLMFFRAYRELEPATAAAAAATE